VTQITTAGSDTHMHDSGRIVGNPEINPVGIRTGSVTISRPVGSSPCLASTLSGSRATRKLKQAVR